MSRPKKDGARATGIYGKKGYLYIYYSVPVIKDGSKKRERKWIATGLSDKPENVKKAMEMQSRISNKDVFSVVDRNISVEDYTEVILGKKQRDVADTTYAAYCCRARIIKEYFGDTKIKDVTESMIEVFLDYLFISKQNQYRTVKDVKVLLSAIMEQAVKEGILIYNPVKNVKINRNLSAKYSKAKNSDEEFFSYEEVQLFLNQIKNHELRELFYLTVFFGLRREEVLGLRWSALNLKEKKMIINHTVTKGTIITRANITKTAASTRTYPLTDDQVDLFALMREKERANRKIFGSEYKDNDYVFKHEDGSLYYPDYPTKSFKKIIKNTPELPQEITFHGLRSSCVSILVHQGMDVKSIQKWVGHADIDTTLRIYAKVKEKEAKKEISERMTSLISLDVF